MFNAVRRSAGFTLVELMIAVAVVAILAAIAVPAYDSYVTKSKLKAAQSDLVALSLNLENRFQKTLAYPTATSSDTAQTRCVIATGAASCTNPVSGWQPSQSDAFTYKLVTATSSTYKVEALGTSGKVNGCSITLTQDNVRAISSCSGFNGSWL